MHESLAGKVGGGGGRRELLVRKVVKIQVGMVRCCKSWVGRVGLEVGTKRLGGRSSVERFCGKRSGSSG